METLELKYIASYLPFGLKGVFQVRDVFSNSPEESRIKDLRTDNVDFFRDFCKPLLRPLSDLTKEIEHNGERFVPIVEIGKLCGFTNLERFEVDDYIGYGWDEQGMEDVSSYEFAYNQEAMTFGVCYDVYSESRAFIYEVGGYLEVQKLLEWHFDIFKTPSGKSLIESGLAIDKNTIK